MAFDRLLVAPLLAACLCLTGCAAPSPPRESVRLERVPRPQRPDWPLFRDGDFLPLSEEARRRLAARHTLTVWYIRSLENALAAWEAQAATGGEGEANAADIAE